MNQLEQSVRLDIYLKKGVITTDQFNTQGTSNLKFPSNCRLGKIENVLNKLKTEKECNQKIKANRMKLLFGEKGFEAWRKSQRDLFENTVMNKLSEEEKAAKLCIPYKSFLSLNSTNELRTTYLKIAKAKKLCFKEFQRWASNRTNPNDTSDILGRETATSFKSTGSARDFLKPEYQHSMISKQVAAFKLKEDLNSKIEPIDHDDIQRLIKTDPVFERMIRDPKFFEAITRMDDLESFDPNKPEIIKLIAESQDRQCIDLYGRIEDGTAPKAESRPGQKPGAKIQTKSAASKKEESLLTKYLCEEDFPRNFIDESVIESTLAAEFKNELGLESEQESTDMLVDYLYCQDDNMKKADLRNDDLSINLESIFQGIPENDDIKNLLNLSLNPPSDLEIPVQSLAKNASKVKKKEKETERSEFARFNNTICSYVDDKCKGEADPESKKSSCSMATLSASITMRMIKEHGFAEHEIRTVGSKVFDVNVSDKELRTILSDPKSFLTPDQIDAIIVLRHQNPKFLKGTSSNAVLVSEKKNLHSDTILAENVDDESASYFSNYFVLGKEEDELALSNKVKITNSSISNGRISDNSKISSPADETSAVPGNDSERIGGGGGVYRRRTFDSEPAPMEPQKPDVQFVARTEPARAETAPKEASVSIVTKKSSNESRKSETSETIVQDSANSGINLNLSSENSSGSGRSFNLSRIDKDDETESVDKKDQSGNEELSRLQDRLKELDNLASEMENSRDDVASNERKMQIEELKNEIKRIRDKRDYDQKISRIKNAISKNNIDRNAGNEAFGKSFSNIRNEGVEKNYAEPYDPLDRGNTGRRNPEGDADINEVTASADGKESGSGSGASGVAAATKAGKGKGAAGGGGAIVLSAEGSETPVDGVGSNGSTRLLGRRYPATVNGEADPDDICGYDQKMNCYFEYASIYQLPEHFPSLQKFVEYLQLQGRSFKAVEVFKYREKTKPTRYFIHEFEPGQSLSQEEKDRLYARAKLLAADYKKNYKELALIAKKVVNVKKTEITKQEVKTLQPVILRFNDLNLLIERRTRGE